MYADCCSRWSSYRCGAVVGQPPVAHFVGPEPDIVMLNAQVLGGSVDERTTGTCTMEMGKHVGACRLSWFTRADEVTNDEHHHTLTARRFVLTAHVDGQSDGRVDELVGGFAIRREFLRQMLKLVVCCHLVAYSQQEVFQRIPHAC